MSVKNLIERSRAIREAYHALLKNKAVLPLAVPSKPVRSNTHPCQKPFWAKAATPFGTSTVPPLRRAGKRCTAIKPETPQAKTNFSAKYFRYNCQY